MNQHGCRDVRCRPTIPTVHVIVHDRSNRQRINAKVNGLDFSTVGVLYFFNVNYAWKCLRKKNPLPLEERFYSKSISVDLWLVYKQANKPKPIPVIYRCFIFFGFGETNHYTLFSHQNFCLICHENRCHWRMSNYILMIRDIIITGLFLITATN